MKGHDRYTETSGRYCHDKYCITRIIKDAKKKTAGRNK